MGTSNWHNVPFCVEGLMKIAPNRVLDVGVGYGRWGMIVREFCELWSWRLTPGDWKVRVEGVEGFAPNIHEYHRHFYNKIHVGDFRDIAPTLPRDWSVIIFGDVIEHFDKEEGLALLRWAVAASDYVMVNVPLDDVWPQGEAYGNTMEKHRSVWTSADFDAFPVCRCQHFRDYIDRPFAVFFISVADPMNLKEKLISNSTQKSCPETLPSNLKLLSLPEDGPRVSVIVAAYNVRDYIGQCLDSLVYQTISEIEIIVVDDASTDGTSDILKLYANEHRNIRYLRHDHNRGLSAVRNTGMAAATGKFVAFLDGDDWAFHDMMGVLLDKAESTQSEIVIADFQTFDNKTLTFGLRRDLSANGSLRIGEIPDAARQRGLYDHCSAVKKLYLRSFLESHQLAFIEGHLYEDVRFHYAVLLAHPRMAILERPVFYYRINRPGQITEMAGEKVLSLFDSFAANETLLDREKACHKIWSSLLARELSIADWVGQRCAPAIRADYFRAAAPFQQFADAHRQPLLQGCTPGANLPTFQSTSGSPRCCRRCAYNMSTSGLSTQIWR